MHQSQEVDRRRVRMEARWTIEAQDRPADRHGDRSRGKNLGVDTAGLLMEAGFDAEESVDVSLAEMRRPAS